MFRLCLALGVPHPEFLEQVLSLRQLGEWQRFYGLEPWGAEFEDMEHTLNRLVTMRAAGSKTARFDQFRLVRAEVDANEEDEYRLAKQIRAAFGLPQVQQVG